MPRLNPRNLLKGALLPIAGLAGLPALRATVEQAASEYRRLNFNITNIRTAEVRVHGYHVVAMRTVAGKALIDRHNPTATRSVPKGKPQKTSQCGEGR